MQETLNKTLKVKMIYIMNGDIFCGVLNFLEGKNSR